MVQTWRTKCDIDNNIMHLHLFNVYFVILNECLLPYAANKKFLFELNCVQ